ncbi:MAG: hypothetical protein ABSG15_01430 [FCB group bacterium]
MLTTYQINSDELDNKLINLIKSNFPNQELFIDVYPLEELNMDIKEITNPKIIERIKDIKANKNLIYPNINL